MWMVCDGESCCSFSIVTILPSCCTGRKMWSSYCHVMLGGSQPTEFWFFFFQVCLLLYGRLAHSAMLVLAILVNLLTESQEVSISFTDVTEHVNTSLHNKFSTVAIWEPQTKALRSQNDSSAEPRQPLVQVQVLSAKEYCFCSSFWYLSKRNQWHLQKLQSYVAHGFSQNTNIIIKPLWPWQFVFLKL